MEQLAQIGGPGAIFSMNRGMGSLDQDRSNRFYRANDWPYFLRGVFPTITTSIAGSCINIFIPRKKAFGIVCRGSKGENHEASNCWLCSYIEMNDPELAPPIQYRHRKTLHQLCLPLVLFWLLTWATIDRRALEETFFLWTERQEIPGGLDFTAE